MIGTVVGAASISAIITDPIVPPLAANVVDSGVARVVAHLMLPLLVIGRIIAAAACLSDGGDRDGTGEGESGYGFGIAGVHVGIPPRGLAM